MSKQAVIAVVVGLIIILGAGGAFLYSQGQKSATQNTNITTSVTPTKASMGKAANSFANLLSSGKTSKCSFSTGTDKAKTNGTVYVSGDKARGDFTTTTNEKDASTHMIKNGDTFYMWGDSLKTGVKMVMNINEMTDKMKGTQDFGGIDADKDVDFKCTPWTLDATQFVAPTSIKFMSLGNVDPSGVMMKEPTGIKTRTTISPSTTGTAGNTNQCNICNSLTGDAKKTCLTQLKCN